MKQVVYIDVLFVLNLFINYFLLLGTGALLRLKMPRWRLLCGASLGGLYSLFIFIPSMGPVYSLLLKLLLSVSIVFVTFKKNGFRFSLRVLGCFYGVNFIFAGFMMAIWIIFKPGRMVINNGVVYFDISFLTLVISTVVSYSILILIAKYLKRDAPNNKVYDIAVSMFGETIETRALLDTGNALTEPFSDIPVAVVEYRYIEPLLPVDMKAFFKDNAGGVTPDVNEAWKGRVRMIPYHSLENMGMLPAFRPDQLKIKGFANPGERNVFVAVCDEKLPIHEYGAILNPRLVQDRK